MVAPCRELGDVVEVGHWCWRDLELVVVSRLGVVAKRVGGETECAVVPLKISNALLRGEIRTKNVPQP